MTRKVQQRTATRHHCLVPVEGKKGSPFYESRTLDISRGGIGFVSNQKIPVGDRIAVELELLEGEKPVILMGQVRWVTKINRSGKYRIGMHFSDPLVAGSQTLLNNYCSK